MNVNTTTVRRNDPDFSDSICYQHGKLCSNVLFVVHRDQNHLAGIFEKQEGTYAVKGIFAFMPLSCMYIPLTEPPAEHSTSVARKPFCREQGGAVKGAQRPEGLYP
jgi:hypothetical protein